MLQEVAAEQCAPEAAGQCIAKVDRPARPWPGNRLVIRQMLEESIGVPGMERPMLAEVLAVVGPLDGVVGEIITVGREEQVAVGVERQAEQVAAPLAEKLEPPR